METLCKYCSSWLQIHCFLDFTVCLYDVLIDPVMSLTPPVPPLLNPLLRPLRPYDAHTTPLQYGR